MSESAGYTLLVSSFAASGAGGGIYSFALDERGGQFSNLRRLVLLENPFFMAARARCAPVYVNNSPTFGAENPESIIALEPAGQEMRLLGRIGSRGSATCHLAVDGSGRSLFWVNYCSGNVCAHRLDASGGFAGPGSEVFHAGSGPVKTRQEAPHPHCVAVSPDNALLWVADLGTDRVEPYAIDPVSAHFKPSARVRALQMGSGAGPRHLRFSRDGRFFAVVNELSSSLSVYETNEDFVPVAEHGETSTLPAGYKGVSTCADVAFSACGEWVFVTNRGHDSVAVCRVTSGRMELVDVVSSGGGGPQNLWVSADGCWLVCANMPGCSVVSFRVADLVAGRARVLDRVEVEKPSCLLEVGA